MNKHFLVLMALAVSTAGLKAQLWSTVLPHASDRLKLDRGGKGTH